MSKTVAVLGARNLGGAIIDHFLELGWNAAGVARSEDTLARVAESRKRLSAIQAQLTRHQHHVSIDRLKRWMWGGDRSAILSHLADCERLVREAVAARTQRRPHGAGFDQLIGTGQILPVRRGDLPLPPLQGRGNTAQRLVLVLR